MSDNLSKKSKQILCKTAVAAGSTDITDATVIDMQDFEGCLFIFAVGTISSSAVCSVGASNKATNTPTPGTDDLVGCGQALTVTTDNDSIFVLDVVKPPLRYLRPWMKRATANGVLNSIIAIPYGPKLMPTAKDASLHGAKLSVSAAVGTA